MKTDRIDDQSGHQPETPSPGRMSPRRGDDPHAAIVERTPLELLGERRRETERKLASHLQAYRDAHHTTDEGTTQQ